MGRDDREALFHQMHLCDQRGSRVCKIDCIKAVGDRRAVSKTRRRFAKLDLREQMSNRLDAALD
jgi:hypothetical protein